MIDREKWEKVIKGLEHCLADDLQTCTGCPYNSGYTYDDPHSGCQGSEEPMRDALALLKAQEPRDAVVVQNGIDGSGGWWFQCPNCMMEIEPRDRYCKSCGQAVKWE